MKLFRAFQSPYVLFLAALTLRLIFAAHLPAFLSAGGNPYRGNEPTHIAAHIAQGEGFSSPYDGVRLMPTAQQPPLYPLLIAGVFKLFGVYSQSALMAILFINALAGAGICLLIYRVGITFLSQPATLIAAWLWALLPTIAATDLFVAHYTLSTAIVLCWLLVLPRMGDSIPAWLALGVSSGLAGLLNPMLLLVIPASWLWLLRNKKQAIFMALAIVATVTPWMVRNFVRLGHFYPALRDNFGLELYIGNHAGMEGANKGRCAWSLCEETYDYNHADVPTGSRRFSELGEAAYMAEKQTQALGYIRSAPGTFLIRTARRFAAFWLLPYPWFYAAVCALSIFGLLRMPPALRMFTVFLFVVYPIAFYVTQTSWASSYRHPIEPLLLLSSAQCLQRFLWPAGIRSSTSLLTEMARPKVAAGAAQ